MNVKNTGIPYMGILFLLLIISSCSKAPPVASSLSISAPSQQLAKQSRLQLNSIAVFVDDEVRDVTDQTTWTVSDQTVAKIENGTVSGLTVGQVSVTASYGERTTTYPLTVVDTTLSIGRVEPENVKLPLGYTQQFQAMVFFQDNSRQDYSRFVEWQTLDSSIIQIDPNTGLVKALSPGTTAVIATNGAAIFSTLIEVTEASLDKLIIENDVSVLPKNLTVKARTTGLFSDGSKRDISADTTWSSNNNVVVFMETDGTAKTVTPGKATITAKSGAVSTSTEIQVTDVTLQSLEIEPEIINIAAGFRKDFSVFGIFSDASRRDITDQIIWQTDNDSIARVDGLYRRGELLALSTGSAEITARFRNKTQSTNVIVNDATLLAVQVTPMHLRQIAAGSRIPLRATGVFSDGSQLDISKSATWISKNAYSATIENGPNSGRLSAVRKGPNEVLAALQNRLGKSTFFVTDAALLSLSITPSSLTLANGSRQPFRATGRYTDGSLLDLTNEVSWSSDHTNIATVSNSLRDNGMVSAIATGNTSVRAEFDGLKANASIEVTAATIDSFFIEPQNVLLSTGQIERLRLIARYSDGTQLDVTQNATWKSDTSTIASVNDHDKNLKGQVGAYAEGSTNVSATMGERSASTEVTVTTAVLEHIEVSMETTHLEGNVITPAQAIGIFDNGESRDISRNVTWSSSDHDVVEVSNQPDLIGQVISRSVGAATIVASSGVIYGSLDVLVRPSLLLDITIEVASQNLAQGYSQQLAVTAHYFDGKTRDITHLVNWSSSDTRVISLNDSIKKRGQITALSEGTSTIYATYAGYRASTDITVSSAVLQSISLSTESITLPGGAQQQLLLTGHFSDASTLDLTTQATWESSSANVVVNRLARPGMIKAIQAGNASVSATLKGLSVAADITVSNATLTSIELSAGTDTLKHGTEMAMVATATYSDASTRNVTKEVTWQSDKPRLALVSNTNANKGLLQAIGDSNDSVTVTASLLGKSASLPITLVYDPTQITAFNLLMEPRVMLDSSGETSNIVVQLLNSDGSSLANAATSLQLEMDSAPYLSFSGPSNSNGFVVFPPYVNSTAGRYLFTITETNTNLTANASLTIVSSFAELIDIAGRMKLVGDNQTAQSGTRFVLTLKNYSQREFGLTSFELRNGETQIWFTEDAETLNNNILGAEETLTVTYALDAPVAGPFDFNVVFTLNTTESGEFTMSRALTIPTP
ncbi:MAG: Ig-like domain-containing protein [Gammaproteobacteria bacterium]|nr:Ig-like domain-containing protein [Gammaproteobacteria bacterium]